MLRDLAFTREELALPVGSTVDDVWAAVAAAHPAVVPHRPYVRAALNGRYVDSEATVSDGDEVAFLPPVSGGALAGLTESPIDPADIERSVADPSHGAVVTFVGRARDVADDGRAVVELEYEAFGEMASRELASIADEAEARWPARIAVVHRHGVVPLGEAAVVIVAAARHRDAAYEANRFVIERIKERLPIWKRERFVDGSEWKRPGA